MTTKQAEEQNNRSLGYAGLLDHDGATPVDDKSTLFARTIQSPRFIIFITLASAA